MANFALVQVILNESDIWILHSSWKFGLIVLTAFLDRVHLAKRGPLFAHFLHINAVFA